MISRLTICLLAALTTLGGCSPASGPAVRAAPAPSVAPRASAPAASAVAPAPNPATAIRHRLTGSGPDLVLVHGNFDRMETWDAVVPALSSSFRVLTLDLVGYGETRNPSGQYTIERLGEGVLEVMNAEAIQSAILVGNSMGGAVVSYVAGRAPDRVAALVLEDANFLPTRMLPEMEARLGPVLQAAVAWKQGPADASLHKATREAVAEALRLALPTKGAVTDKVIDHFTTGFDPKHVDAVLLGQREFDFSAVADGVLAARKSKSFPVLVLWGSADPLLPVGAADAVQRKVQGARLVIFEGCGHAPHLERPESFASSLRNAFGAGAGFPTQDMLIGADGTGGKLEPGWLQTLAAKAPASEKTGANKRPKSPGQPQ